jgi:hypothetical protein
VVKLGARRAPSLTQLRGRDTHAMCGPCIVRSMPDAVQGWDTSVRGTISKGCFVPGAQHPRTFGQGHIGRGHINPASGGGDLLNINNRALRMLYRRTGSLLRRVRTTVKTAASHYPSNSTTTGLVNVTHLRGLGMRYSLRGFYAA